MSDTRLSLSAIKPGDGIASPAAESQQGSQKGQDGDHNHVTEAAPLFTGNIS